MKSKHISLTIMAVMLTAAFVLGACILITPAASADTSTFSAENAATYLKVISSKPHSVFDAEAHEEVRQYLKNTLTDMGLTVEEHDWNIEDLDFTGARNEDGTLDKTKPIEYDIHNLWVTIPGKSETGMLLMAHYDSRGHTNPERDEGGSYGAADDGFGVVTLLEIARLYASVPKEQLETSLYFCFTDAEETGMFGAKLEARDNQIVKDHVNFVMNVEARGVRGPAFMFETSKKNEKVMELYAKTKLPATYSVATAVYSVMTNFTDFTAMLDIGKAGVNFSTLDNINYYHVPEDNFSNISKDSIQHYGEQIVPMIEEYTSSAKYADMNYFNGEKDAVFFDHGNDLFAVMLDAVLAIRGCAGGGFPSGKIESKTHARRIGNRSRCGCVGGGARVWYILSDGAYRGKSVESHLSARALGGRAVCGFLCSRVYFGTRLLL